ncbi:hypothetical protein ACJX0J_033824, partial [Zea mays]
ELHMLNWLRILGNRVGIGQHNGQICAWNLLALDARVKVTVRLRIAFRDELHSGFASLLIEFLKIL